MRDKVILACTECKERNYNKTKNKRLHPERVEYKKYCPRCNDAPAAQGNQVSGHHGDAAAGPLRAGPHHFALHGFLAWLTT